MAYKINVPNELRNEYKTALAVYNNSGDYKEDLYGDLADSPFGDIFSTMMGGGFKPEVEITKELYQFIQTKFNYLIVGKDAIKLLSIKNN